MTKIEAEFLNTLFPLLLEQKKCLQEKCEKEQKALLTETLKHTNEFLEINKALEKNEITKKEAEKKRKEVRNRIRTLKEAEKQMACSMKHCKNTMKAILDHIIDHFGELCEKKKPKSACKVKKELEKIQKRYEKDEATLNDFYKVMDMM